MYLIFLKKLSVAFNPQLWLRVAFRAAFIKSQHTSSFNLVSRTRQLGCSKIVDKFLNLVTFYVIIVFITAKKKMLHVQHDYYYYL